MFIDTSEIIALLVREHDADHIADRIQIGSAIHFWPCHFGGLHAAINPPRSRPYVGRTQVETLLEQAGIEVIAIDDGIAKKAVAAYAAFGKGRGHPAQLNLADCMSYACAQSYRVPLLFKGNDFAQTDIRSA